MEKKVLYIGTPGKASLVRRILNGYEVKDVDDVDKETPEIRNGREKFDKDFIIELLGVKDPDYICLVLQEDFSDLVSRINELGKGIRTVVLGEKVDGATTHVLEEPHGTYRQRLKSAVDSCYMTTE